MLFKRDSVLTELNGVEKVRGQQGVGGYTETGRYETTGWRSERVVSPTLLMGSADLQGVTELTHPR